MTGEDDPELTSPGSATIPRPDIRGWGNCFGLRSLKKSALAVGLGNDTPAGPRDIRKGPRAVGPAGLVGIAHGGVGARCYILGVRERSDKLVRDLVLGDPAPFIPLTIAKRGKEIDYEAKAVMLAGRRYIVCRNREEMKKDAAARTAILAALERQLKKGDKTLVGNKGYRRFLATPDDDHFVIDRAKAEEDAKFDGLFVLRTNTDLSPLETMLCYKHLWMVERAFRTSKSLFATRPIFHKLDETIRGHVSCSFLALVLKKELEDRIATLGHASSWPNLLADLNSLTETEVEQDGKRFLLRTPPRPAASLALRAAGVALPPTVRQLADA